MTTTTAAALGVGAMAPDFTLASTDGSSVTLSTFRGASQVLIAFFPLAFTSVCTAELCGFSDGFDDFAGAGVTVLPISVDAVPSLKEFRAKYDMKVALLSDFKREASRAFGVLREDTFFAKRAYFLVDQSGVIQWAHVESTIGEKRDNAELLAAIRAVTN